MTSDALLDEVTPAGIPPRSPLRIVVGSDSNGHEYKTALKAELDKNTDVSLILDAGVMDADDGTAYPHIAVHASKMIITDRV
jgi:ribose 5-phosphate isomerase RpiB